jgi:hypothetical protein
MIIDVLHLRMARNGRNVVVKDCNKIKINISVAIAGMYEKL